MATTMQARDIRGRRGLDKAGITDENAQKLKPAKPMTRAAFADLTNTSNATLGKAEKVERPVSGRTSGGSFQSARESVASTQGVTDDWVMDLHEKDQADVDNPQAVAEYAADIFVYLKEREQVGRVGDYMTQQEDLTEKMRAILVDWLVEVHWKFKLQQETLSLTVHLLDTYLSKKQVKRQKLQLVGVTCMLLAAKHEEIYPPEIKDFVHVTDRAYTRQEILDMEVTVLNTIGFQLTHPSGRQFLMRYVKLMGAQSVEHAALAEYSLELSLVNYRSMRYAPSHLGAASLLLANKILKVSPAWPQSLVDATGFAEATIKSCAKEMCSMLQQAEKNSLQAVRKKYSHATFHRVAKMVA